MGYPKYGTELAEKTVFTQSNASKGKEKIYQGLRCLSFSEQILDKSSFIWIFLFYNLAQVVCNTQNLRGLYTLGKFSAICIGLDKSWYQLNSFLITWQKHRS